MEIDLNSVRPEPSVSSSNQSGHEPEVEFTEFLKDAKKHPSKQFVKIGPQTFRAETTESDKETLSDVGQEELEEDAVPFVLTKIDRSVFQIQLTPVQQQTFSSNPVDAVKALIEKSVITVDAMDNDSGYLFTIKQESMAIKVDKTDGQFKIVIFADGKKKSDLTSQLVALETQIKKSLDNDQVQIELSDYSDESGSRGSNSNQQENQQDSEENDIIEE